jgi:hypothetical protein
MVPNYILNKGNYAKDFRKYEIIQFYVKKQYGIGKKEPRTSRGSKKALRQIIVE